MDSSPRPQAASVPAVPPSSAQKNIRSRRAFFGADASRVELVGPERQQGIGRSGDLYGGVFNPHDKSVGVKPSVSTAELNHRVQIVVQCLSNLVAGDAEGLKHLAAVGGQAVEAVCVAITAIGDRTDFLETFVEMCQI